jgi:hypothetical protein
MKRLIVFSCLGAFVAAASIPAEARTRKRAHLRQYEQRLIPTPYPGVAGRPAGSPSYTPGAVPSGGPAVYQPISPSGTPSLRERF